MRHSWHVIHKAQAICRHCGLVRGGIRGRGKHHNYQRGETCWIRYPPTCTRTWPDEWAPTLGALTMNSPRRKTR